MTKKIFSNTRGFTLIEIILVIAILSILLAITIIAINPTRQFASAHNSKRQNDTKAILDAIAQFQTENHGALPGTLSRTSCPPSAPCEIEGTGSVGTFDLCPFLVSDYLAAFPVDPLVNSGDPVAACNSTYSSGYQVYVSSSSNRVTITAPSAELGSSISVSR